MKNILYYIVNFLSKIGLRNNLQRWFVFKPPKLISYTLRIRKESTRDFNYVINIYIYIIFVYKHCSRMYVNLIETVIK